MIPTYQRIQKWQHKAWCQHKARWFAHIRKFRSLKNVKIRRDVKIRRVNISRDWLYKTFHIIRRSWNFWKNIFIDKKKQNNLLLLSEDTIWKYFFGDLFEKFDFLQAKIDWHGFWYKNVLKFFLWMRISSLKLAILLWR